MLCILFVSCGASKEIGEIPTYKRLVELMALVAQRNARNHLPSEATYDSTLLVGCQVLSCRSERGTVTFNRAPSC